MEGVLAGGGAASRTRGGRDLLLNYNSSASLDPYATNDTNNLLISQLVFDNIFELSDDHELSSRIITSYSSENGSYWTFTVDTSIKDATARTSRPRTCHTPSSARKHTSRYSGRFTYTYGVSATSEDTFVVNLGKADWLFPYLLNIPVVKTARRARRGPSARTLQVRGGRGLRGGLQRAYNSYQTLPVDRIYFKEYSEARGHHHGLLRTLPRPHRERPLRLRATSATAATPRRATTRRRTCTTSASTWPRVREQRAPAALCAAAGPWTREYAADTLMGNGAVASLPARLAAQPAL